MLWRSSTPTQVGKVDVALLSPARSAPSFEARASWRVGAALAALYSVVRKLPSGGAKALPGTSFSGSPVHRCSNNHDVVDRHVPHSGCGRRRLLLTPHLTRGADHHLARRYQHRSQLPFRHGLSADRSDPPGGLSVD